MSPFQSTDTEYRVFSYVSLIIFIVVYAYLRLSSGRAGNNDMQPLKTIAPPLPDVIPLQQGTIDGCPYAAVASSDGRIDVFVTLKRPLDFRLVITGTGLPAETVGLQRFDLEGDFPDAFQVYCEPGFETRVLELLDPADMVYLMDFCKGHELRFEADSFIIGQPARPEIGDATSVLTDAEKFIAHNRVFWQQFQ